MNMARNSSRTDEEGQNTTERCTYIHGVVHNESRTDITRETSGKMAAYKCFQHSNITLSSAAELIFYDRLSSVWLLAVSMKNRCFGFIDQFGVRFMPCLCSFLVLRRQHACDIIGAMCIYKSREPRDSKRQAMKKWAVSFILNIWQNSQLSGMLLWETNKQTDRRTYLLWTVNCFLSYNFWHYRITFHVVYFIDLFSFYVYIILLPFMVNTSFIYFLH